jgi:putative nucleotidyltransferase with HDIG domain
MAIPNRDEALNLLKEHVKEPYQVLHSKMVAQGLEKYAEKYGEDKDLWYLTGLLHDLDYYEHPSEHPAIALSWFKDWGYPDDLMHAVLAHGFLQPRTPPKTNLAKALIAVDEMSGLLYAYSLMRPTGFEGMEVKSVKKKFKDKAFAAKIDRHEVEYGMNELGVTMDDHAALLIDVFVQMPELKK